MIFSYRKLLQLTNIKIISAILEETDNNKCLGMIFDKHLAFENVIAPQKNLNLHAYYLNYQNICHYQ